MSENLIIKRVSNNLMKVENLEFFANSTIHRAVYNLVDGKYAKIDRELLTFLKQNNINCRFTAIDIKDYLKKNNLILEIDVKSGYNLTENIKFKLYKEISNKEVIINL